MGWHYREIAGMEVIESEFEAHHTKVPLHMQVYGEASIASVVAQVTVKCPPTHRSKVAELLMRVNKELNLGNFEMDWDSGITLYRLTNIFPPNRHDERILASLVHTAVAEVDRLTPFLGEICKTSPGELLLLQVPELLNRAELLPPEPTEAV